MLKKKTGDVAYSICELRCVNDSTLSHLSTLHRLCCHEIGFILNFAKARARQIGRRPQSQYIAPST